MDEPNSKSRLLQGRTNGFAVSIVRLFRSLPYRPDAPAVGKQLLRSGTSVAANYRAACRARSKAEFVAKIGVVSEEADESVFWLELMRDSDIVGDEQLAMHIHEGHELSAMFTASYDTARGHRQFGNSAVRQFSNS